MILLALAAAALPVRAFGFYFNFGLEEIPMMILGLDKDSRSFYSFFNILNGTASVNVNDDLGFQLRLKYTFFAMTNVNQGTTNNQHKLYLDRLYGYWRGDGFSVMAGRNNFFERNGLLIGNLADGVRAEANLIGFKWKLYGYYSGLLPKDLNQFSADIWDATNAGGANRLSAGLVIEKYGWFFKSIALTGLYSANLVTNYVFSPFYLGLNLDGTIIARLTYDVSAAMEFGSVATNVGAFGWAGSVNAVYFPIEQPVKLGFTAEFSLASGDDEKTTNSFEGFNSFGRFNTGYVLAPDFSNLFFWKVGVIVRALEDKLTARANFYNFTRLSTNDTVSGLYNTTNAQVGSEISGSVSYDIDPNVSVFLNAGVLFGNLSMAVTNKNTIHKVVGGMTVKF